MNRTPMWCDADFLKGIREANGLSQSDLSERSGVSRAFIANVESGRRSLNPVDGLKIYGALVVAEVERRGKLVHFVNPSYKGGTKEGILESLTAIQGEFERAAQKVEREIERLQAKVKEYRTWAAKYRAEEEYWRNISEKPAKTHVK